MGSTFHYFTVQELPELDIGDFVETRQQLALPVADNEPLTRFERIGLAEDEAFDKYFVTHQIEQEVDGVYRQEPLHRFLENRRFPVFRHRSSGYLLVAAAKPDARKALQRLANATPPLKTEVQEIELAALESLGSATGGWFGRLQIADVKTAGLFGTSTVTDSEEWRRYAEDGELNALLMKVVDEGDAVKSIMVTRERVVVLHKDEGEAENLRYARYLQETIDTALA